MSEQYKDNTFCFHPKKKICTCRSLCLQVCKKVFKPVKNVFNTSHSCFFNLSLYVQYN